VGTRVVAELPGDCRGFGTAYRGLATDGTSFYYALLTTREPPVTSRCGEGGRCRWQLAGGRIVRVDPHGKKSIVPGLAPAALVAGAPNRLARVAAAPSASSNGQSFDWPRAATSGKVILYDTSARRVVASFAPRGIVRAVALSSDHAVVLVQTGAATFRIEWYDAEKGTKQGSARVPPAAAPSALASDGDLAAFSVGNSVHVLDLGSGQARLVARTPGPPVGLSLDNGRLAWGENATSSHGRVAAVSVS
jgi:hypothetical protein